MNNTSSRGQRLKSRPCTWINLFSVPTPCGYPIPDKSIT